MMAKRIRSTPDPSWWATARELRAQGMPYLTIAKKLGRSFESVRRACMPKDERLRLNMDAAVRLRKRRDDGSGRKTTNVGKHRGRDWWAGARTLRAQGWKLSRIAAYYNANISIGSISMAVRAPADERRRCCAVCFKPFACPPSSKTVTCSKGCSSEHRSRVHIGVRNQWSDDARARKAREGRTDNLRLGSPAAQRSPLSGAYETNINGKTWLVVAPGGAPVYEARNLRLWCERHATLFEPSPWKNAYAGLRQVAAWRRGKTKRTVSAWKGWTVEIAGD